VDPSGESARHADGVAVEVGGVMADATLIVVDTISKRREGVAFDAGSACSSAWLRWMDYAQGRSGPRDGAGAFAVMRAPRMTIRGGLHLLFKMVLLCGIFLLHELLQPSDSH
jgi:hypothetical protein